MSPTDSTPKVDNLVATAYLVLERRQTREGLAVAKSTQSRPALESGQVAVRVRLLVPRNAFDALIPTIEAQLSAPDLIEPVVEVITPSVEIGVTAASDAESR